MHFATQTVAALRDFFDRSRDLELRALVLAAYASSNSPAAARLLLASATAEGAPDEERADALGKLGWHRESALVGVDRYPPIVAALTDKSWMVRDAAAQAASGAGGDPRVLPALISAFRTDPDVRVAMNALCSAIDNLINDLPYAGRRIPPDHPKALFLFEEYARGPRFDPDVPGHVKEAWSDFLGRLHAGGEDVDPKLSADMLVRVERLRQAFRAR